MDAGRKLFVLGGAVAIVMVCLFGARYLVNRRAVGLDYVEMERVDSILDARHRARYESGKYFGGRKGWNKRWRTADSIDYRGGYTAKRYVGKVGVVGLEINGADSLDLVRVRGVGGVFASRILRYRWRLGGFSRLDQLAEIRGLEDSAVWRAIAAQLAVDTTRVRVLDLERDSLTVIRRHPYVSGSMYRRIVRARKEGTPINLVLTPQEMRLNRAHK